MYLMFQVRNHDNCEAIWSKSDNYFDGVYAKLVGKSDSLTKLHEVSGGLYGFGSCRFLSNQTLSYYQTIDAILTELGSELNLDMFRRLEALALNKKDYPKTGISVLDNILGACSYHGYNSLRNSYESDLLAFTVDRGKNNCRAIYYDEPFLACIDYIAVATDLGICAGFIETGARGPQNHNLYLMSVLYGMGRDKLAGLGVSNFIDHNKTAIIDYIDFYNSFVS